MTRTERLQQIREWDKEQAASFPDRQDTHVRWLLADIAKLENMLDDSEEIIHNTYCKSGGHHPICPMYVQALDGAK